MDVLDLERRRQTQDDGALECLAGRFVVGAAEDDEIIVQAKKGGEC